EVATSLLLDTLGWRGLLWADAAVLLVMSGVAAAVLRDPPLHGAPSEAREPSTSLAGFWRVYLMPGPMRLMTAFAIFTFSFMVFAVIEPTYLIEAHGQTPQHAANIAAFATLFGIVGTLIAGWLIRIGAPLRAIAIAA